MTHRAPPFARLVQGEAAALRGEAITALVDDPIARLLSAGDDAEACLRLARYEQLSGRDRAAFDRLTALQNTDLDAGLTRAVESQRRLAVVFEPSLDPADRIDALDALDPATELRLLVATAYHLLMTDGFDRSSDRHARWRRLLSIVDTMEARFVELTARRNRMELLDAIDLLYFVPTVALSLGRGEDALDWIARAREAAGAAGIGVMHPFLDVAEAAAHIQALRVEQAALSITRAVRVFAESGNSQWWMTARSIQMVLDAITDAEPPDDLAALDAVIVTGSWRDSRRSQGHAVLMAIAMALASRNDVASARSIAESQGDVGELVLNSVDRALLAETIFLDALHEGDLETATRVLGLIDRLMPSPFVVTASGRMRAQLERASSEPALQAAQDLGLDFEVLRARWLLLAQAVARGRRDAALDALANLDAFASQARMAAVRIRAVQLFRAPIAAGAEALTTRQLEVASLAADGYTNREISAELFISVRTVEGYLAGALRGLGLSRREDLATVAVPIARSGAGAGEGPRLTLRQGQVAALIAAGASNADIAQTLRLSRTGVDKHVRAIKDRTGAHTRTAIAAAFAELIGTG